ncbi:type I toxin-antitoxin system Fst family toxin [Staphylococcus saprophyticus]|nr:MULTISPECIES: type I toxin-antitoxin system Fst family toxin [Staphylococcus]MRF38243.1 type I toxin-antitoxin system Fst family toxin [Staphylococcus sp. KY49P]MCD4885891.1 type I toxin-antitoxin system Fst family toxin [Staphylococcus aureus]MEB5576649.1 type I toxin-antitoxin system Fst family toxin [Staphylococcus hominis]HCX0882805.1 type I toxin-antitoxin system Fst family toxin [Staphylococcus aureus]HCX1168628.1 type I toxin-antitoxin system Fst family toxin [Staphylococcus aureus]
MSVLTIIYSTLIAPIFIGIVLTTYKHWLNNRKR